MRKANLAIYFSILTKLQCYYRGTVKTDKPLFSIFSPKNVPAKTVNTNVSEFVIGTANDNSACLKDYIIKLSMVEANSNTCH